MNILFLVEDFKERGVEVAIYDYANYNELILNNKSYIITYGDKRRNDLGYTKNLESFKKFSDRFLEILYFNTSEELKEIIIKCNADYLYALVHGSKFSHIIFKTNNIFGKCKLIKHCVFETRTYEDDFTISISNFLNEKFNTNLPVIPHMISIPNINENLRDSLNIPQNVIVFGRYGGYHEFNISFTHEAIRNILKTHNYYFIFMNTEIFYEHPNIKYLKYTTNLIDKAKFINTCDCMIHGRLIGETFGLSIGEFSSLNKPIITIPCGDLEHIKILKDKAIIYNSLEDLNNIFLNIRNIINNKTDWNAYKDYTPEKIMNLFNIIIFKKIYYNIYMTREIFLNNNIIPYEVYEKNIINYFLNLNFEIIFYWGHEGDKHHLDNIILNNIPNKKYLILFHNDFNELFDIPNNIILYRTGLYKSQKKYNEFILPCYYSSDIRYSLINRLLPVLKTNKPKICFSGAYITYSLRRNWINFLENSEILECNFIDKQSFRGGTIEDLIKNFETSEFAFCPRGTGNFSIRFYEALYYGRIPVIIDTDISLPFDFKIDWKKYIVISDTIEDLPNKIYDFWLNNDIIFIQNECKKIYDEYFSLENISKHIHEEILELSPPFTCTLGKSNYFINLLEKLYGNDILINNLNEIKKRMRIVSNYTIPQFDDIEAEIVCLILMFLNPKNIYEISHSNDWSRLYMSNTLDITNNKECIIHSFDDNDKYIYFNEDIDYLFIDSDHNESFAKKYIDQLLTPLLIKLKNINKKIFVSVHDVFHSNIPSEEGKLVIEFLEKNSIEYFYPLNSFQKNDIKRFRNNSNCDKEIVHSTKTNPCIFFVLG